MAKNEIEQMVNTISVYEKRLFDRYLAIENLTRDYSSAFERLKSQQQEINKLKAENTQLKAENAQLKADIIELEIECNRRKVRYNGK